MKKLLVITLLLSSYIHISLNSKNQFHSSHPIPSHPIPSHPIPSHPIPSHSAPHTKPIVNTPLMKAIIYNDQTTALNLIKQATSADLIAQDYYGRTPLILAIVYNPSLAMSILNKMNPNALKIQDHSGNTALMKAIVYNNQNIALNLIKQATPADLITQDYYGRTPLMLAVVYNPTLAISVLNKMNKQGIMLKNKIGETALDKALVYGQSSIAAAINSKLATLK